MTLPEPPGSFCQKRRRTQLITPHVLALAAQLLRSGRVKTIGDAAAHLHVSADALRKCMHADGRIRPRPGRRERILRVAEKIDEAVKLMGQRVPMEEICRRLNLTKHVLERQLRIRERQRRLARQKREMSGAGTLGD